MNKDYIAPVEAHRKLQLARRMEHNVYLYGATGYGKTTLIKQYLDFRSYEYIDCSEPGWEEKDYSSFGCLVFDQAHLIQSTYQKHLLTKLMDRDDVWVILSSRADLASWLRPYVLASRLVLINEKDLHLKEKEIEALSKKLNLSLSKEDIALIYERSEGNAYVISLYLSIVKEKNMPVGLETNAIVAKEFIRFLDDHVIGQWDMDIQDFMMKMSVVDSFDEEFAERITGEDRILQLIERSGSAGNFLEEKEGIYYFRPIIKRALLSRGYKKLGKNAMNQCYYNAGRFYEYKDEIIKALEMYEKIGDNENIRSLLVRNGRKNPGAGFYYELRKYYLMLPEEEVENDPILMSALSMLYSVLMQEDKSEYWYAKLKNYSEKTTGGEKREALRRLAYLNIALPHRGSAAVADLMRNYPKLAKSGLETLPEMSVTNNQPSVMNGGKDFCEWSKIDKFLANTIGVLIEKVLHDYKNGIIDHSLGESFYEKGVDSYEVLKYLSKAQLSSQDSGKIELSFATIGIQVRLNVVLGDMENAKRLLQSFGERIVSEGANQLRPNFNALRFRLALYNGEKEIVKNWIENEAPDEQREFCTLDRYRYLTKLRYYIIHADYIRANALIGLLRVYAEKSKRTYILMELDILESVVRFRQKQEWKELFTSALCTVCEYDFIRILSEEGALVYPLLKEISKEIEEEKKISSKWFKRVITETKSVAEHYPAYGGINQLSLVDFKETDLWVLKMQAQGKTQAEIAEALGVTLRTVKYYSAENYRKLGVSGKTEAVQKARNLNLI
ncbi:MAG: LuxR C-terminal-related transcriptional regulator [Lachnospiraceae bacterium]|nr:LuxR C-terminal-related transcriptional regulator [Lachnospiraceae bacterium]